MGINKEKLLKELTFVHSDWTIYASSFIKNFPEDPEQTIDFYSLWDEYKKLCNGMPCDFCKFDKKGGTSDLCFFNFLKSKNLTQPQVDMDQLRHEVYVEVVSGKKHNTCAFCGEKKYTPLRRDDMGGYVCLSCIDAELTKRNAAPKTVEIPMKRTWTLKKEYAEFSNDFKVATDRSFELSCDPVDKLKKYYDLNKDVDYSNITSGSIVELENGIGKSCFRIFSHIEYDKIAVKTECHHEHDFFDKNNFIRIVEQAKE